MSRNMFGDLDLDVVVVVVRRRRRRRERAASDEVVGRWCATRKHNDKHKDEQHTDASPRRPTHRDQHKVGHYTV